MASSFIRCPSCGFCLGPYYEFFEKARTAYYNSTVYSKDSALKDFDPEKITLHPGSTPDLEELFIAMNIKNRCCRMRILSKMDFDKLFNK